MFGIGGCRPPQPSSYPQGEPVIRKWPLVVQGKRARSSLLPSARPGCAPDRIEWPFVTVLVATRSSPLLAHALIMRVNAGVVVQRIPAKRMFAASELPSASLPIWDILFPALGGGWNPAGRGHFRPLFRTTSTGLEARFGPFSVPLRPLSLTQPNHGHFGTDVRR